jgi:hypothetical protein
MEIGKAYIARKPAESFGEIDGESVDFDEVTLTIEILKKPETVIMDDGEKEVEEPLPKHLCSPDWQLAKNLETFRTNWLFIPNYIITAL